MRKKIDVIPELNDDGVLDQTPFVQRDAPPRIANPVKELFQEYFDNGFNKSR